MSFGLFHQAATLLETEQQLLINVTMAMGWLGNAARLPWVCWEVRRAGNDFCCPCDPQVSLNLLVTLLFSAVKYPLPAQEMSQAKGRVPEASNSWVTKEHWHQEKLPDFRNGTALSRLSTGATEHFSGANQLKPVRMVLRYLILMQRETSGDFFIFFPALSILS